MRSSMIGLICMGLLASAPVTAQDTQLPMPASSTPLPTVPVSDAANITWLAQVLLPPGQRSESAFGEAFPAQASSSGAGSQLGGAAITAGLGQSPFSRAGVGSTPLVGFGLGLAFGLFRGGAPPMQDDVSGIFLPKEIDGVVFNSWRDVYNFIVADSFRNISEFAQRVDRDVTCFAKCNTDLLRRTYALKKRGEILFSDYDPPTLYITIETFPRLTHSTEDHPFTTSMFPFIPYWYTDPTARFGYIVCLTDKEPTETFSLEFMHKDLPSQCTARWSSQIERLLLRTLTGSGRYYFGTMASSIFAWHGRIFTLGGHDVHTLIAGEIPPEVDGFELAVSTK